MRHIYYTLEVVKMVGLFAWCLKPFQKQTYPRWPVKKDYEIGGELYGVFVPWCLPISCKLVKFIYGSSYIKQSKVEWLKVITRLNNDIGDNIYFCECCDWIKIRPQTFSLEEKGKKKNNADIPMSSFQFHTTMLVGSDDNYI